MESKDIIKGIKYIIKVGRNAVAVEVIKINPTGGYLVKKPNTTKTFSIKSAERFVDFQNEKERSKAIGQASGDIPVKTTGSKMQKIMGHSKCAFVKAMGQREYKHFDVKKVLDAFGISMPDASIKIQIYFGKNEKTWAKFGKPAELTAEQVKQVEEMVQ